MGREWRPVRRVRVNEREHEGCEQVQVGVRDINCFSKNIDLLPLY